MNRFLFFLFIYIYLFLYVYIYIYVCMYICMYICNKCTDSLLMLSTIRHAPHLMLAPRDLREGCGL